MTHLIVHVPDEKMVFFQDLMNQFGFESELDLEIPIGHQELVLERKNKTLLEELVPWEKARKSILFK